MIANSERSEVEMTIAGRAYVLMLSMEAGCEIQRRMKKTVGELMLAADRLDYDAIRVLMWAALQFHHASEFPTIDKVNGLLNDGGGPKVFFRYAEKLAEMEKMDGEAKAAAESNPPGAQADGTGDNSRSLLAASA